MSLLIKNGNIITADSNYTADIFCEDETISKIATNLNLSADTVIDASGKYVFPGFIDPHTHIYLPFMGTYAKDTYETATKAALCGGTTTLFDFVIPNKDESPMHALETWQSKTSGACHDYGFHMGVTRFDDDVESHLREIVKNHGVKSFKVFLAYKGAFAIDDTELYKTLQLAKELDVIVTVHCENAEIVAERSARLVADGKLGPEYHYVSRPPFVEAEGTRHICSMAESTGARIYIVHLSCLESLKEATEAKYRGVDVWVETLIQYLLLDKTAAERPNFEGANFVMSPPLRDKSNQDVLWAGLKNGLISTLATDHAPFDLEQKKMGKDNFTLIPNGIPSLEDRVRMLYTNGVTTGRLSLNRFVDIASTQAAKLFNLFPKKGTIQLGADADLVVYDPTYEGTISKNTHHMNIDYNPFEGLPVKGRCAAVSVRGNIQVEDGEFVGADNFGHYLKR